MTLVRPCLKFQRIFIEGIFRLWQYEEYFRFVMTFHSVSFKMMSVCWLEITFRTMKAECLNFFRITIKTNKKPTPFHILLSKNIIFFILFDFFFYEGRLFNEITLIRPESFRWTKLMMPDFPHNIRIRLAQSKLKQPTGQKLNNVRAH